MTVARADSRDLKEIDLRCPAMAFCYTLFDSLHPQNVFKESDLKGPMSIENDC